MRFFALIILILLIPLSILISLLIYFPSRKNIFFKQIRIGKDKTEFLIYKFKTMENNEITKIGRYLRKLGLDEIPQLLNIIKNEMAFVGPRPLTEFDINRLSWNKKKYNHRWSVKPGITGIAQLTKICDANLSLKNDLYYVENKNFILDFKLIIKSFVVPFIGKHTK